MSAWDLQGYGARWNRVTRPSNWGGAALIFAPGCFEWDGDVELQFMHLGEKSFGKAKDIGLRFWQDSEGLAFQMDATVPGTRTVRSSVVSLLQGVADGRYCECSAACSPIRSHTSYVDGEPCEVFEKAKLIELTICPSGACPDTGAWLLGNVANPQLLPVKIRPVVEAFYQASPLSGSVCPRFHGSTMAHV